MHNNQLCARYPYHCKREIFVRLPSPEDVATGMITNAWKPRLSQADELRKDLRRGLIKIEKQIDILLDRIVETTGTATIKAYERKIGQLEKDRFLMTEKMKKSFQPRATPPQMLELSMKFLSNPWKLWASDDINLQKMALRLAFSEALPYHRNEGYRTAKTTLPFNVLRGICGDKCQMVRLEGETSNTLFETLEDWNTYLNKENIELIKPSPAKKRAPNRGPSP